MRAVWIYFFLLSLGACAILPEGNRRPAAEPAYNEIDQIPGEKVSLVSDDEQQRVATFYESSKSPFQGCILFLEGFADSMRNHQPLFSALNSAGYRVLAFDYLGQGNSDGDMADSRINAMEGHSYKRLQYEIGEQAKRVWARAENPKERINNHNCAGSPKRVIGWDVGGLVAYKLAWERWTSSYVMINPQLAPTFCDKSGTSADFSKCTEKSLALEQPLTLKQWTHAKYAPGTDPHLDPFKPTEPSNAKEFIVNLLITTHQKVRIWRIHQSVRGLVFLSGGEDPLTDQLAVKEILKQNARNLISVTYEDAMHEIDNEVPEIAIPLQKRILEFFNNSQENTATAGL